MPSYPNSVKSFTAKASGQNIDPAHVNDIQDEVNAIEAGLLNGTAPLNSSGSTIARLQVTGGSTLTTLNVTGGSTVTTLQAAGSTFSVRPVEPPPEAALVFLGNLYDAGSSANSTLAFVGETFVINSSMHSTGTNPQRLIPQSTGVFQLAAQLQCSSASAGPVSRRLVLVDSSGGNICEDGEKSTDASRLHITGYKRFDALGGFVLCQLVSDGASTTSLSSGFNESWFSMVKL